MEDRTSRYIKMGIIKDYEGVECQETFIPKEIEVNPEDSYFTVTVEYENRLDLISMKFYKNPLFWWVIAEASDISDPFKVPVGTKLRIPSTSTLFSIRGIV